MRDHADNYARTHFETRERRSPERAAGPRFDAAPERPTPAARPTPTTHPNPATHSNPTAGAMPVNERAYRRISDPADLFRPLSNPGGRGANGRDEDEPGYVIHLPIRVDDLAAATRLAYTVAGSLAFLQELDPGETTVSTADDQNNRHRVFCDLLLPDRSRCPQQFAHAGSCGQPPEPEPEGRPATAPVNGAAPVNGTGTGTRPVNGTGPASGVAPETGTVPRQWDRPR
jgi:hypothetical protein